MKNGMKLKRITIKSSKNLLNSRKNKKKLLKFKHGFFLSKLIKIDNANSLVVFKKKKSDPKMKVKEFSYKIVLIGATAVGKTSLVNKYVTNQFQLNYIPTLGVNVMIKDLDINGKTIQLLIWDVGGQDKWQRVRNMYYRGSRAAIAVYDTTDPHTLEKIPELVAEYNDAIKDTKKFETVWTLIGNKIDLSSNRKVDIKQGEEMKDKIKASNFYETSAKTGENVEDAFTQVAKELLTKERI